jgi:ubiquinone/menaquinone biosynthesis C-methylase UbiE
MMESNDGVIKKSAKQDRALVKKVTLYDRAHLKMISLIHDSSYRLFVNPKRLLVAAGLKAEQTALEVGCGPGFFTVPAAEIVGKNGHLYSLDINPAAVVHVREKVERSRLTNVEVTQVAAADTGLAAESVDVAFFFGIVHSLKELDPILGEMHRVLRKDGILAVQRSSSSEKSILNRFTKDGLFHFTGKEARIYKFVKN